MINLMGFICHYINSTIEEKFSVFAKFFFLFAHLLNKYTLCIF